MKKLHSKSPWLSIAIGLLGGGVCLFLWFLWVIGNAHAEEIQTRAVTAQMHAGCADMPHGNQEMEEKRYECFNKLYGQGRWVRTNQ